MKRVMVIGCCGAGKSTLSRNLRDITGLPLYHLDQLYWKAGWHETPKAQWEPIVADISAKDKWIIDGNYSSTMDIRIAQADTIIFMDFPVYKCLYRVVKRIIKYRGHERPDMPKGCKERFDFDFLHYVATFNFHSRRRIVNRLETVSKHKRIVILNHDQQVQEYLSSI